MDKSQVLGTDLIKQTFQALKGKFGLAFVGAICFLAPLAILSLIPYVGWIIAVVAFGYLAEGYISFLKEVLYNKSPKLYTIYKPHKNLGTVIFLGVVLALLILLGLTFFIVPGILVILYYSMSLHVVEDEKSQSVMETLKKSASLMHGHKTTMASYKIFYYLAYALSVLLFGVLFLLNDTLYTILPFLSVIILVVLIVSVVLLFAFITTYFITNNVIFYDNILTKKDKAPKAPAKKDTTSKAAHAKKAPAKTTANAAKETTAKKQSK